MIYKRVLLSACALLCASATSVGLSTGRVSAQGTDFQPGQTVEAYWTDRRTGQLAWQKATVTEVFNWGAHVKLPDGHVESIGNSQLRVPGGPTPAGSMAEQYGDGPAAGQPAGNGGNGGNAAAQAGQAAPNIAAADGQWQPGQQVEANWVDRKTGQLKWQKAVITEVFNWGAHVRFPDGHVESMGNWNIRNPGAQAPGANPAANAGGQQAPAQQQPAQQPQQQPQQAKAPAPANKTGACECDAGLAQDPGPNAPLPSIVKHLIYEQATLQMNGNNAEPVQVGVTFQDLQIGKPFGNGVTVTGNGITTGVMMPSAPQGGMIYPVTTHHVLCRHFNNTTIHSRFQGGYYVFQNRFGKWEIGTNEWNKQVGDYF